MDYSTKETWNNGLLDNTCTTGQLTDSLVSFTSLMQLIQ